MLFTDYDRDPPPKAGVSDQPLAARLRPRSFEEYAGQQHIIGPGKLLRRAIESDRFTSIILYGPPGTGKTSLAELIAKLTASHFERLSAVAATVADVRQCIQDAVARKRLHDGRKTILFLDEIHRFNRAQQDVLLPDVENGNIRLIGATTENPFFHIVGPLVSRSQLFQLQALTADDIRTILQHACQDERAFPNLTIDVPTEAEAFWAQSCEGDARRLLTAFEVAVLTTRPAADGTIRIDLKTSEESLQQKAVTYGDDGHYDTISAFIKSMRGSDPDAAVYWLAKMLQAGEDIRFIARRIVIFASEDIGNADPRALTLAVSAMQAVNMIGMPEARIILSQATTYCATAPKSKAAYKAIAAAIRDVRDDRVQPVPVHLRDAHYQGAKRLGHGEGYKCPHDESQAAADQVYLQIPARYYEPVDMGYERRIRERMEYWESLRKKGKTDSAD